MDAGDEHGDFAAQMQYLRADALATRWELGTYGGRAALLTWVELDDEAEGRIHRGELDARELVEEEIRAIAPIVEAIATQANQFFDVDLPELLRSYINEHRHRVQVQAAVEASLTWPDEWMPEPLSVEPAATVPSRDSAVPATELALPPSVRLATASFATVLRTIRVWANAIERTPEAFGGLHEERLSDLAAATLNASMPGAQREVFTRGGKSDIFVRADVIDTGTAPAKVFIFENKWWDGEKAALAALEQLFGYLEVKDPAAVLMFFVKLRDPAVARTACLEAFKARPDCDEAEPIVAGWPIVRFRRDYGIVDVCVAFVDVPPP